MGKAQRLAAAQSVQVGPNDGEWKGRNEVGGRQALSDTLG